VALVALFRRQLKHGGVASLAGVSAVKNPLDQTEQIVLARAVREHPGGVRLNQEVIRQDHFHFYEFIWIFSEFAVGVDTLETISRPTLLAFAGAEFLCSRFVDHNTFCVHVADLFAEMAAVAQNSVTF